MNGNESASLSIFNIVPADPELVEAPSDATVITDELPVLPRVEAAIPVRRHRWRRLVAIGLVGLAMATAGCTAGGDDEPRQDTGTVAPGRLPEFEAGHEQNLLTAGKWDTMPGVTVRDGKLVVGRTGLAVLRMDEGGRPPAQPTYEANPPVNLFGVHAEATKEGNVGFAAQLANIKGEATLSFMSSPTTRYDERVERHEGIDVTVAGDKAIVKLFDGSSNEPTVTQEIKLDKAADAATVSLAQNGGEVVVAVNGKQLKIQANILKRQTWFGFNATDSWDLGGFSAFPVNGNEVKLVDGAGQFAGVKQSPNGLAATAAAHGHGDKLFGTAVDPSMLMSNPEYTKFVLENFNLIETEMAAKFQAIQPEEGHFEFAELDGLVAFAEAHGITVHGHALAFTEAYPKWLADKLADPATTDAQALELLRTHIKTTVGRYDGQHGHGTIARWDVGNEVFDPDEWAQFNEQNIWHKKLGYVDIDGYKVPKYIIESYKAAREANPKAELWLNDWAGETDADRRGAMFKLAKYLKSQGLLDGVGFQMHFDEDTLDDDEVMDGIYSGDLSKINAQFAAIGLKVRYSEASVAENDDAETQAEIYGMIYEACVRSRNCTDVNVWGATNSEINYPYFTGSGRDRDPGNDAPTTQGADGKIIPRRAWVTIKAAVAA